MRVFIALLAAIMAAATAAHGQETSEYPSVLPMQERAALRDIWLEERLNTIIAPLMRERDVDMWVLLAREYNEDPVLATMLPADWMSARRQTILVFFDNGETVERLAVSRYAIGNLFKGVWVPEEQPDQWKSLADLIADRAPRKIAINTSNTFALADGLSHSQYERFLSALEPQWQDRIVSDPALAIGWLERRLPEEMAQYPHIVGLAHAIIHEGLSSKTIIPGKTTANDLKWWFRNKIRAMGVTTWFHPSISIQRASPDGNGTEMLALFDPNMAQAIHPGDLIHLDFGIKYMGLNSDTQHHAYVLKSGETDAPKGLKQALAVGNRLQDILTDNFKTGLSGNAVLAASRATAIEEGIEPWIYTHPIGYHGHGAGATIGLWDQQGGVEGRGDYPVMANTAWSIELSALVPIPEWNGQKVRIMLEEDAYFDGQSVRYIDGRQTAFHLIGTALD